MIIIIQLIFLMLIPWTALADGDPLSSKEELCDIVDRKKILSADYIPNIDIHGKAITPADISNTANNKLVDNPIIIPITLDLAQIYGLNLKQGAELKPSIAHLRISQEGHISFDNEDITKKIISSCSDVEKTEQTAIKTNGHKASDAVLSSDKIEGQYPEYNE